MKFNRRLGREDTTGLGVLYDAKYFSGRNDEASKRACAEAGRFVGLARCDENAG